MRRWSSFSARTRSRHDCPAPGSAPPARPRSRLELPLRYAKKVKKKAVDADVAQTRQKQCADAQDRYKKIIEGRHLYKPGANGEREYLTSEQIDTERLNAKRDVDTILQQPDLVSAPGCSGALPIPNRFAARRAKP